MKPQIPWLRVFVEGVVIVGSILLAFGVDAWWEERQERALEQEYLERLVVDMQAGTSMFGGVFRLAETKEGRLTEVAPFLLDQSRPLTEIAPFVLSDSVLLTDTAAFLQILVSGAALGWQEPRARRATFEELQNTGNLRVIRDAHLRGQITTYYRALDDAYRRIQERRGTYPASTYELIPRGVRDVVGTPGVDVVTTGSEFAVSDNLMGGSRAGVIQAIRESSLRREVVAERNFASFTKRQHEILIERAIGLLQSLEAAIGRDD